MSSGKPARRKKGGDELSPKDVLNNRYVVDRQIADGGMASIYLAHDRQTGERVAVKALFRAYNDNAVVRERFIDEGRIQMILKHPNIVRVYELVHQPALAFVMEYVEGGTLEDYLQEKGTLDQGDIVDLMLPVMSALGMSHQRGIIHRDLKPSNILLTKTQQGTEPKVMDFGVAKLARQRELTATGTTVGTLHYMSPEQIVGSKRLDGRADIYSLGITLYKLATGEVPFNASTEFALMMAQVEAQPTPPSVVNNSVSLELEAVILKALAKKPSQRYQTIKEFTEALVGLVQEHTGEVTMDTMSVPEYVLRYALMADQVAVDMTDEVIVRELDPEEAEQRTRNIQRSKLNFVPPLNLEEAGASNATIELGAQVLRDLRETDASRSAMESMRETVEDDMDAAGKTLVDDDGDATQLVVRPSMNDIGYPPTVVGDADTADLTNPNGRLIDTQDREMLRAGPRRLDTPRFDPGAFSKSAQNGPGPGQGPPRIFGPSYVDTRERTHPHVANEDVVKHLQAEDVARAIRGDLPEHSDSGDHNVPGAMSQPRPHGFSSPPHPSTHEIATPNTSQPPSLLLLILVGALAAAVLVIIALIVF